jgi:SAM-dependent methyltransferase
VSGTVTRYAAKLQAGSAGSDDDWNEHLLHVHRTAPGMTACVFARHEVLGGIDCYDLILRGLEAVEGQPATVVDLACGDGHLIERLLGRLDSATTVIGVDMSEDELALARRHHGSRANVEFRCERAQSLSLPDGSADVVLCHMALMVMRPLAPVVDEVARVLRPGGVFAAVIASSRQPEAATRRLHEVVVRFLDQEPAGRPAFRVGEPEARTREGLQSMFSEARGFEIVELVELSVHQRYPAGDVWQHWRDSYLVSLLDDERKARLRQRLAEEAARIWPLGASVELQTPIQYIVCRRRPAR